MRLSRHPLRCIAFLFVNLLIGKVIAQCPDSNCSSSECGCIVFTIDAPSGVMVGQSFDVAILASDFSGCECQQGMIQNFQPNLHFDIAFVHFTGVATSLSGWDTLNLNLTDTTVFCEFEGPDVNVTACDGSLEVATFQFVMDMAGTAEFTLIGDIYFTGNGTEKNICGMSSDMVLPLDLLSFTAELTNHHSTLLIWRTANEINASHFEIERSLDASHWINAGQVSAYLENSAFHDYTFEDHELIRYPAAEKVYYRLRMVDIDGRFSFSPIVTVALSDNKGVSVIPNPATDVLYVNWAQGSATKLLMLDLMGCEVYAVPVQPGDETRTINLASLGLANGVYILQLVSDTQVVRSERIVISNQ